MEDEWERELYDDRYMNLLFVTYDASRISLERITALIRTQGFESEVVESE